MGTIDMPLARMLAYPATITMSEPLHVILHQAFYADDQLERRFRRYGQRPIPRQSIPEMDPNNFLTIDYCFPMQTSVATVIWSIAIFNALRGIA